VAAKKAKRRDERKLLDKMMKEAGKVLSEEELIEKAETMCEICQADPEAHESCTKCEELIEILKREAAG